MRRPVSASALASVAARSEDHAGGIGADQSGDLLARLLDRAGAQRGRHACTADGLPPTASARATASAASGRIGVVALWSR